MKNFRIFILALFVLTLALAIVGCEENSDGHSHSFEEVGRVDATCGADGVLTLKCSCGEEKTETLPKTGEHNKGKTVEEILPTCSDRGYTTFACSVCGELMTESVDAKGHSEVSYEAVAPTCTKVGYEGGTYCSDCGLEMSARTKIPATNLHTVQNMPGSVAATCTTPGYEGGTYCTTCQSILSTGREIPPTGIHTEVVDLGYAASCTSDGMTNGKHCTVCSTVTLPKEIIPALTHNYEYEIVREPEYLVDGEGKYTCSHCGDTYTEPIPALPYLPDDIWDGTRALGFASGEGTEQSPYVIETAEQLAYFAAQVNNGNTYLDQYVCLGKDIIINDLSNYASWATNPPANSWTPIGHVDAGVGFCGNFNGNGYSVRGIYSVGSTASGLFGRVNKGVIENVNVTEAYIRSTANVAGGIVGDVDASDSRISILSCGFEGTVISPVHAGGIVGYARCGWYGNQTASSRTDHSGYITVSNCTSYGTVRSSTDTIDSGRTFGGIVGHVRYTCGGIKIESCYNAASVTSNGYAGGIVGRIVTSDGYPGSFYAVIEGCQNDGGISGACYTGGISAYVSVSASVHGYPTNYCTVTGCINNGEIIKTSADESSVGGLFGALRCASGTQSAQLSDSYNTGSVKVESTAYQVGGLVGSLYFEANDSNVSACYNEGNVSAASSRYTGGLFGQTSISRYNGCLIDSCYNSGDVTSLGNNVGGITGYVEEVAYTNVYNTGDVSGEMNVGGVFGYMGNGTLDACYNAGKVKGSQYYVGAIVGCYFDSASVSCAYYLSGCAKDGADNRQGAFGQEEYTTGNMLGSVSAENMTVSQSFDGFDFDTVWTCDGYNCPTLMLFADQ